MSSILHSTFLSVFAYVLRDVAQADEGLMEDNGIRPCLEYLGHKYGESWKTYSRLIVPYTTFVLIKTYG